MVLRNFYQKCFEANLIQKLRRLMITDKFFLTLPNLNFPLRYIPDVPRAGLLQETAKKIPTKKLVWE